MKTVARHTCGPVKTLSRRELLMASAWVGGGLMIGPLAAHAVYGGESSLQVFGPFIRITRDNQVTVISKHSELGQGAQSGLAAIVAEELGASWDQVRVEMSPADSSLYGHTKLKIQITGGSSSIANSWEQLRYAGAAARQAFASAAAKQWQCAETDIIINNGVVSQTSGKKKATLGELAELAAKQTLPEKPTLKDPSEFSLLGTRRVSRLDARAKSSGQQTYTLDVQQPGLLTAVVAHSPKFGGKLKSFDGTAAKAIDGVVDVFSIATGVAVIATGMYPALQGRKALSIEWDDSNAETRSDADILQEHQRIAQGKQDAQWHAFDQKGSVKSQKSDQTLTFDFPYLAHATMEPMNCVATLTDQGVELSYGAQSQSVDQMLIAPMVGCETKDVIINTLHCGGSFGRRSVARADYQRECVSIAQQLGKHKPVKLVWTREDDMSAGEYRPMAHHQLKVSLGKDGYPNHWAHKVVSASLFHNTVFQSKVPSAEGSVIEGVKDSVYFKAIDNVDGQVAYPLNPIPVLWLRSVGHTHTAFAMEHAIDQLARTANIDPVDYRRTLYRKAGADKHLAVLEKASELSGWGTPLEAGWARGIAVHESFGTVVANVAEVSLTNRTPKVRKVFSVIDCGFAVAPDQIDAQMTSGIVYGLTYSLYGEVKLKEGIVQNSNFDRYRVLRMSEVPEVINHIMPSANPPSGAGEPGTPVVGPAVANALLVLSGKPTSRLPFISS